MATIVAVLFMSLYIIIFTLYLVMGINEVQSFIQSFNHFRVTYYCQSDDNCNLKYQHRRFRKSDLHWNDSPSHKESYIRGKSDLEEHVE